MTEHRPVARCPGCGRSPNVSFSAGEVRRAKRERQAANVVSVKCPKCRERWWIKARDIAAAKPNGSRPPDLLPADFPEREILANVGVTTISELLSYNDPKDIPAIGPARARRIRAALDRNAVGA